MPPRITRLIWPRLFPRHQSSPILYPRWYSVENAPLEVPESASPKDSAAREGQDATTQNELGEAQSTPTDIKTQDKHVGIRRVVPSLQRKEQKRKLEEVKRMQLRGKAFYSRDWRTPLALLRKNTPVGEHHHVKQLGRLQMPEGMRGFYPGNLSNLFLDIYLHTQCHVQISRSDEHKDDKFSALELSGTLTSINMAKNILNETVQVESDDDLNDKGSLGSYTITSTPVVSDKVMPRSVWSIPRVTSKPLHDIQEPETWSFNEFAAYVEALVNSAAPPLRLKSAVPSPETAPHHIDLVAEKLMDLYKNPESVRWASSRATVLTLQYLTMKGKVPLVRLLLEIIEVQSKTYVYLRLALANPSVYNVLLDSASQALDLHTYNFLLRMMTDRGVTPTIETWTSLLHLVQKLDPPVAKHIVNTMRKQGMLSTPTARATAAGVTLLEPAEKWLGRDESIFDFIAHHDKLWEGKEWLEPFGCNQLLTSLVNRGNLQDTLPLVKELQSRNKRVNLVTAHILINAAASYRDLAFAMDALEATIGQTNGLQPDRHTYDKLFHLTSRIRAYNTLRVVWRYACLSGNVSQDRKFKMSTALRASLRDPAESAQSLHVGAGVDDTTSRHQRFKTMAPIVAVGITEVIKDVEALRKVSATQASNVPTPSSSNTAISSGAAGSTDTAGSPDSDTATEIPSSADTVISQNDATPADAELSSRITQPSTSKSHLHSVLAADLLTHGEFVPTKSFLSALREAVDKDLLWKQQGYDKTASLQTLLAEAVTVRVERRKGDPSQSPLRKVEVEGPQLAFSEDRIRKWTVESPQTAFQEDKIRRVETEVDALQAATARKLELQQKKWSKQEFKFRALKLETEEEKQAYREKEEQEKRLAEEKRLALKKRSQEREKRLEEKKRLEAKKRLEKRLQSEGKRWLEAKQKLEQDKKLEEERIKKLEQQLLEDLDNKLETEAQKWLKATAKREEQLRIEEEQTIASLKSLASQIRSSDASNEQHALGEEEKKLLAKEQAIEGWKQRQEEEKRVKEEEAAAEGEWKRLHEEMREMLGKK